MAKTKEKPCPPCPPCGERSAGTPPDLRVITGSTDIVAKLERGDFVFPEYGFYRSTKKQPCKYRPDKPMPPGHVELDIISERDATGLGVKPGPTLRLCQNKGDAGALIPVKDPNEAKLIGAEYRKCVVKDQKDGATCSKIVMDAFRKGQSVKLGRTPKRVKRSRK